MQLVLLIQLNSFLAPGGLAFTWLTSVVKQLQSRPFCTTISVEKGMNKPTACGVDLNFQNKKKKCFLISLFVFSICMCKFGQWKSN